MTAIMIKVDNDKKQGAQGVLRQFTRKVNTSGILKKVKAKRYYKRARSEFQKRKDALRRIERRSEVQRLLKLGKPIVKKSRRNTR